MQKVRELILEVYHYEKKTEIETRYLSNVLLWFALMVFLINLFNNSMEKNPGIYIFCLVACAIGVRKDGVPLCLGLPLLLPGILLVLFSVDACHGPAVQKIPDWTGKRRKSDGSRSESNY